MSDGGMILTSPDGARQCQYRKTTKMMMATKRRCACESQTLVRDRAALQGEIQEVLADLSENGARVRLARGGRGGKGNRSKPTGKLAGTRDLGTDGEKITVVLELKSVADVGLVGFPNSGKSTLLRAISGAQPKVAGFAFTTMHPQLGAVMTDGGYPALPSLISRGSSRVPI